MKNKLSLIILLVSAAALLTACASDAPAADATASPAPTYDLIAEGRLAPAQALDLSFAMPGAISEVLVEDGENVSSGALLARLGNNADALLALARAEQEALAADQALADLEDKSHTDDEMALMQARVASAKAAVASAQAALEATELRAPFSGTVIDPAVIPGEQVTAYQRVVSLVDTSDWVVETNNLTEIEVVDVSIGQEVEVTLDALPNVTLKGTVSHINSRYEENRGDITYTVTVTLKQVDPRMRWGMTASVTFLP